VIVILFFIYLVIAITMAIFINKKLVSKFEDKMRKIMYVITFLLCIATALGEFAISTVKKWMFTIIDEKSVLIERMIIEQYPDSIFHLSCKSLISRIVLPCIPQ
jgi:hypothetical protein